MTDINTAFRALLSILSPIYHSANSYRLEQAAKLIENTGWVRNYAYQFKEGPKVVGVRVRPDLAAGIDWMPNRTTIVAYDLVTAVRACDPELNHSLLTSQIADAYRIMTQFNVSCQNADAVIYLLRQAAAYEKMLYNSQKFNTLSLDGPVRVLINIETVNQSSHAKEAIRQLIDDEEKSIVCIDADIEVLEAKIAHLHQTRKEKVRNLGAYEKT